MLPTVSRTPGYNETRLSGTTMAPAFVEFLFEAVNIKRPLVPILHFRWIIRFGAFNCIALPVLRSIAI